MKHFAFALSLALLVSAGLVVLESASYAHGPHHGGYYNHNPYYSYPAQPQLTQEQMEKAKQIFLNASGKMDNIRQSLYNKQNELNAEMSKPTPSNDKISSLSREVGELRGKLLSLQNDIRSQLTKEGLPAEAFEQNYAPANMPPYYQGMPCYNEPCYNGNGPCWGGAHMRGPGHCW